MGNKEKYQIEVPVKASPQLLYQYISTPEGLASWYADDVRADDKHYTFVWNGIEERALLSSKKTDSHIRFHWEDDPDSATFFEIRIKVNALTNEVMLLITDFALPAEIEESQQIWNLQINDLKIQIGAI